LNRVSAAPGGANSRWLNPCFQADLTERSPRLGEESRHICSLWRHFVAVDSYRMARGVAALLPAVFLATICGCGSFLHLNRGSYQDVVAAAEIPQDVINTANTVTDQSKFKQAIGVVVIASERRCDSFTKNLTIGNIGSNTFLDVTTTALSAAATAVTPLGAVHGLTAASTLASGSKTAINADVFAKATIANLAQAVNATYYRDMKSYEDQLVSESTGTVVMSIEIAKILSIHKECALDTAEASISSTLGTPPAQSAPATVSKLITVSLPSGMSHAGDMVELDFTSSTDNTLNLKAVYPVMAGNGANDIAMGLVAKIQGDPGFSKAGITATQNAPPNDDSFVVQAPGGISVAVGPAPPAAERLSIADTATPSKSLSNTGTQGVVPGRAITAQ